MEPMQTLSLPTLTPQWLPIALGKAPAPSTGYGPGFGPAQPASCSPFWPLLTPPAPAPAPAHGVLVCPCLAYMLGCGLHTGCASLGEDFRWPRSVHSWPPNPRPLCVLSSELPAWLWRAS